MQLAGSV